MVKVSNQTDKSTRIEQQNHDTVLRKIITQFFKHGVVIF
jgi:hypothetical protein